MSEHQRAKLATDGVHRDLSLDDPIAGATLSQRVVRAASSMLTRDTSRRSFLTKTAVVGSALAVAPLDFVLRPGTAYGAVCGTCGDGYTAFCCTVNGGRNSCPPGSFVAGWWKADNAAYCCGAARYIIDCNASCPTSCRCGCSGASCDARRTCCNQFRYGQCHQEISCYGPVVCRIATCTPPWRYDPSCSTSSATDNATVTHGAPCIGTDCGPPPPPPLSTIDRKYGSLGGAAGILGPIVQPERAASDQRGRYAIYRNGRIYWTPTTPASEVHGAIRSALSLAGDVHGFLGYPTSDTKTSADSHSRYSNFERGRIYLRNGITTEIHDPIFSKHEQLHGVYGVLGYPTSDESSTGDGRGRMSTFENGGIYWTPTTGAHEVHGAILYKWASLGAARSGLGYPTTEMFTDGSLQRQNFEHGRITYDPSTQQVTVG